MTNTRYVPAPTAPWHIKQFAAWVNCGGGAGSAVRLIAMSSVFGVGLVALLIMALPTGTISAFTLLVAIVVMALLSGIVERRLLAYAAGQLEVIVLIRRQQNNLPIVAIVPACFDREWRSIACDTYASSMRWLETVDFAQFVELVKAANQALANTAGNDSARTALIAQLKTLYKGYMATLAG